MPLIQSATYSSFVSHVCADTLICADVLVVLLLLYLIRVTVEGPARGHESAKLEFTACNYTSFHQAVWVHTEQFCTPFVSPSTLK
jgi:hypothetical protein